MPKPLVSFYKRAVLITGLLLASVMHTTRAADLGTDENKHWRDGIVFVQEKLTQHPVVALGEIHHYQPFFTFVSRLLADPVVRAQIDDVIVDFGNARYQADLDAYVLALQEVPRDRLALVWQEHAESPTGPYEASVYEDLVSEMRRLNAQPGAKRIRLVAADLPLDWAKTRTLEDYRAYGPRSRNMGQRVVDEVLKQKRRALFIAGGAHLARRGYSPGSGLPLETAANVLEAYQPGSLYSINAVIQFGPRNAEVLPRLRTIAAGQIVSLADHWLGALPAPMAMPIAANATSTASAAAPGLRKDLVDAYLWLGEQSDAQFVGAKADTFASDARWTELNRRAQIRFGRELDPASRASGQPRLRSATP